MPTNKKKNRSRTANGVAAETRAEPKTNIKNERKLVDTLLAGMVEELKAHKPSVGDLIRLLQFRRELAKDKKVREIEVRWVEASSTENVSST